MTGKQGAYGADVVGFGGVLVRPVPQHSGEAQCDAAGIAGAGLHVVEIELDGVQTSTRYPGGVALRFARVLRYRPDKDAAEADDIGAVRALLPGHRPA